MVIDGQTLLPRKIRPLGENVRQIVAKNAFD